MSPFVYPLDTWPLSVQLCVITAVCCYCFVALIAILASIQHDRQRPLAILSLGVFFVCGWLYVVLHFTTHTVAFLKVFTGTQGEWQVTTRSIKGTSPDATPAKVKPASAGRCRGAASSALTEPLLNTAT